MNHLTSIGFRGIPHRSHWSVNVVASLGFVEQISSSSSIDESMAQRILRQVNFS